VANPATVTHGHLASRVIRSLQISTIWPRRDFLRHAELLALRTNRTHRHRPGQPAGGVLGLQRWLGELEDWGPLQSQGKALTIRLTYRHRWSGRRHRRSEYRRFLPPLPNQPTRSVHSTLRRGAVPRQPSQALGAVATRRLRPDLLGHGRDAAPTPGPVAGLYETPPATTQTSGASRRSTSWARVSANGYNKRRGGFWYYSCPTATSTSSRRRMATRP